MNHLRTFYLLDLADDLIILRDMAWTHQRRESAMLKLAQIDEELLSRMPAGEFVTLYVTYDENSGRCHYCNEDTLWGDAPHTKSCPSLPDGIVGFAPNVGDDREYEAYLAYERHVTEQIHLDDSSYYFYRD